MTPGLQNLDVLAAHGTRRQFIAGEQIFSEGDRGDELYVLLEGTIEIGRDGSHIDSLSGHTILGEMALVDAGVRSATAVAATPVTVIAIDLANFREILRAYPDFATEVMAIMTARLRRLTGQEVQRQRIEQELEIGQQIQLSLLPEADPALPGWALASYYEAARQVGGDMYDYVPLPDDDEGVAILIADVTGKGVPAAMFMAVARTMLHSETRRGHSPAETLERVNEIMVADNRTPLFLSALSARLSGSGGQVTMANAGHEAPVLLPAHGEARFVPLQGLVLGAFPHASYDDVAWELDAGDTVVLYTDGVTEARNEAGKFFGEDRLLQTVAEARGRTPADVIAALVTAVRSFRGAMPRTDDLTVVVFQRRSLDNNV